MVNFLLISTKKGDPKQRKPVKAPSIERNYAIFVKIKRRIKLTATKCIMEKKTGRNILPRTAEHF